VRTEDYIEISASNKTFRKKLLQTR